MKRVLTLISGLLILLTTAIIAQSPAIDSLLDELKDVKEDSNKVNLLANVSYELARYNYENALQYSKLGIYLGEKLEYKKGLASCYKSIGVIYYYQNDYQQSLENYFKCLNLSKEINEVELTAGILNNIGQVYYLLGNFDLALEKCTESLKLEEQLKNDLQIAKVLNMISIIHQEQGKYPLALENYFRSLKIYEERNDKEGISDVYNNIGLTYMYQGTYDQSLDYYFKGLAISEELTDSTIRYRKIANAYLNIGSIYDYQEDYEKALDYFNRSILIFKTLDEKFNLSFAYDYIGRIYHKKKNYDQALEYYFNGLEICEEIDDQVGVGLSYTNIGESYARQGEYSKALDYLFISLKISEENGNVNNTATNCLNIGEIYFELGNYSKSLQYLNRSKQIGNEIGALEAEKDASEALSRTYSKLNNYKLAYENHVLFKTLFDKLKSDENVKSIAQREMQYEFDKKQKQQKFEEAQKKAARDAERKRERLIRFIFIIIITFVMVFAFFMLRSYQIIKKSNILLAQQRDQITEQKQSITDSIIYAKRIQTAVLPSPDYAEEILSEHFILFKPRDIVSGDFFWMTQRQGKSIIVAADCTGHGVPGAFMSMLGVSFLNEIVNKNETSQANLILNQLRAAVKKTLDQTGKKDEAKDGMDLALCIFDYENKKMQYAGAYNPLYLYRNNELIETKADKMPIGIHIKEKESFTNHEFDLQKDDTFYIFSDGFVDQFGGEKGQKFKSKKFKELLLGIQDRSLKEQKEILDITIENWRGDFEQLDDICVVGIRI